MKLLVGAGLVVLGVAIVVLLWWGERRFLPPR